MTLYLTTGSYRYPSSGKVKRCCLRAIIIISYKPSSLRNLIVYWKPFTINRNQICSLRVIKDIDTTIYFISATLVSNMERNYALYNLLKCYQEVFNDPKGFSPPGSHDHTIALKKGAQPVNLRPYRYFGLQMDI